MKKTLIVALLVSMNLPLQAAVVNKGIDSKLRTGEDRITECIRCYTDVSDRADTNSNNPSEKGAGHI
jgi:hypothetical protein